MRRDHRRADRIPESGPQEIGDLEAKVREAEHALRLARDAIWIRIDQMTDRRLATRATAQEAKREAVAEAAAIGGYEPGERRG